MSPLLVEKCLTVQCGALSMRFRRTPNLPVEGIGPLVLLTAPQR